MGLWCARAFLWHPWHRPTKASPSACMDTRTHTRIRKAKTPRWAVVEPTAIDDGRRRSACRRRCHRDTSVATSTTPLVPGRLLRQSATLPWHQRRRQPERLTQKGRKMWGQLISHLAHLGSDHSKKRHRVNTPSLVLGWGFLELRRVPRRARPSERPQNDVPRKHWCMATRLTGAARLGDDVAASGRFCGHHVRVAQQDCASVVCSAACGVVSVLPSPLCDPAGQCYGSLRGSEKKGGWVLKQK